MNEDGHHQFRKVGRDCRFAQASRFWHVYSRPLMVRTDLPVAASQMTAVWSWPQRRGRLPSGLKATLPCSLHRIERLHKCAVESQKHIATALLSRRKPEL